MSAQNKQVVVVDSDVENAASLASLITFLEYEAHVVNSHQGLAELCSSLENIVAVLVSDDPELEQLNKVVGVEVLNCPC
jgi:CheY-like chemotaxis protein